MAVSVAAISPADRDAAAGTLTMAFAADPMLRWVFPRPDVFLDLFPMWAMLRRPGG